MKYKMYISGFVSISHVVVGNIQYVCGERYKEKERGSVGVWLKLVDAAELRLITPSG